MDIDNDINDSDQDCWRRIGIWGNESTRCEKLKYVKHCRNCEVFEQVARVAMTERRKKSEGNELSIESLVEKEALSGNLSLMPFRIGNKCIAVPSSSVITISDQVAIHTIPYNTNPVIKGLVAINHEVYTFISISKLLNLGPRVLSANVKKLHSLFKRTLVVDLEGRSIVFYVDEVYPIHRYFKKDVSKPDKKRIKIDIFHGVVKNKGEWCDDCQLLSLPLTSKQLEATAR